MGVPPSKFGGVHETLIWFALILETVGLLGASGLPLINDRYSMF